MYKISLADINVPPEVIANMAEVLASQDIGQNSHFIKDFEKAIADFTGAKHCIVTSSGTMADAVAVAAMKVKYNPVRVIVPALTFIAQPNSVFYNGLEIEFVDITRDYLMNWEEAYKFDERTSIYFPSDCMGRISTYRYSNRVIEDACEAFGSILHGTKAGRRGEIGTFSFFVSHTITTGEGGAIITDDDWLANLCYSLRSHGRASDTYAQDKFSFPHLGFNGKLSAPQAAIGCGVMAHVKDYIKTRHSNYIYMQDLIGGFSERAGEYLVPHGFPIEFRSESDRNDAMRNILEAGIECRKFFSCIPTMEQAYKFKRQFLGRFPVAEHVAFTHLYVPVHQNLSLQDVKYIADVVNAQNGRTKGDH